MTEAQGATDDAIELEFLQEALVAARSDLQLHAMALSRLQGELMASRQEVTGARGETVHLHGYLSQLQDQVAQLSRDLAEARAEATALRGSFSWRVTRPVRVASTTLREIKRKLGRTRTPAAEATSPRPEPAPPRSETGTVSVEELRTLSRSP